MKPFVSKVNLGVGVVVKETRFWNFAIEYLRETVFPCSYEAQIEYFKQK